MKPPKEASAMPLINFAGQRFGMCKVLRRAKERDSCNRVQWELLCNPKWGGCGGKLVASRINLRKIQNCGECSGAKNIAFPFKVKEGVWLDVWRFQHVNGRMFFTEKGAQQILKLPPVTIRRYGKKGARCKFLSGKKIFTMKIRRPKILADEKVTVYLYSDRNKNPADLQIIEDAYYSEETEPGTKDWITTAEAIKEEDVSKDQLQYWEGRGVLVPRIKFVPTTKRGPAVRKKWHRLRIRDIKQGKVGSDPFSGRRRFPQPGVVRSLPKAKQIIKKEILKDGPMLKNDFFEMAHKRGISKKLRRQATKALGCVTKQSGLHWYVCLRAQIPQIPKNYGPSLQNAMEFLRQALADGNGRAIPEILKLAKKRNIHPSMLYVAKDFLNVKSDGKFWSLPVASLQRCKGDFKVEGDLHVGGRVIESKRRGKSATASGQKRRGPLPDAATEAMSKLCYEEYVTNRKSRKEALKIVRERFPDSAPSSPEALKVYARRYCRRHSLSWRQ
jgi:hypothetical protein